MGASKELWMQQMEQGFTSNDAHVCCECVGDGDLAEYVNSNGSTKKCNYCHKTRQAIEFDQLMERIIYCIKTEYTHVENELGRDDGEWVTLDGQDPLDTYDILQDKLEINSDKLREDILSSAELRQWCEIDYYGSSPVDIFLSGWERFIQRITHKNRFTFYLKKDEYPDEYEPEGIPTQHFLKNLTHLIESIGLYASLEEGTILYRVRAHDQSETFNTAAELGTPPVTAAKYSNRMSPAGIPMFYCSEEAKTSIKEVFDPARPGMVTVGKFVLLKRLHIVDLTKIPPTPSLFSGDSREVRHAITFMKEFAKDISKPSPKDSKEKIEYIPTQIMTEHIRFQHEFSDAQKVDGIVYTSSKGDKEKAMVLFIENEDCVDAIQDENDVVKLLSVIRIEDRNEIQKILAS